VKSHLPVLVRQAGSELRAAGLDYDHAAQRLALKGPLRAQLTPKVTRP
jgi:lipopolysaccharide export system protein LptC